MQTVMAAVAVAAVCAAAGQAADVKLNEADGEGTRNHGVYVGIGFGPTQFKADGAQREVSGIDFSFSANANDLGGLFYVGGWITDHVGLELGTRDYGTIDVPFTFHDPHDNTSGTGESKVSVSGVNLALMLGVDVVQDVQLVGRAGVLIWQESFESRFDIPGRPAIKADVDDNGTGGSLGLGLVYRFTPGWQLEGRYEYATLGDDKMSLVSVGISYDFIDLLRK